MLPTLILGFAAVSSVRGVLVTECGDCKNVVIKSDNIVPYTDLWYDEKCRLAPSMEGTGKFKFCWLDKASKGCLPRLAEDNKPAGKYLRSCHEGEDGLNAGASGIVWGCHEQGTLPTKAEMAAECATHNENLCVGFCEWDDSVDPAVCNFNRKQRRKECKTESKK